MIKKFDTYNESLRDKMTPKSDDDIRRDLSKLSPKKKLSKGIHNELPWLVEDAIKSGADPNMTYPNSSYPKGFTCLMMVIITNCNLDIIKLLVKYGADVNAKTKNGSSVLGILNSQIRYEKQERADDYMDSGQIKDTDNRYQMAYDFIKSELGKTNESVRDKMTPISDDKVKELRSKGKFSGHIIHEGYTEKQTKSIIKRYSRKLNRSFKDDTERRSSDWCYEWTIRDSADSDFSDMYLTLSKYREKYTINFTDGRHSGSDYQFIEEFDFLEDALNWLTSCRIDVSKITRT